MKITIECYTLAELVSLKNWLSNPTEVELTVNPPVINDTDRSIDELAMTARTSNVLKANDIKTIKALIAKNDSDLLRLPLFGRKCLREVRESLKWFMEMEKGKGGHESTDSNDSHAGG